MEQGAHILRRLGKDITISELQRMREEDGLSNTEIARNLDVSYPTILKYLGPQRKRKVADLKETPKKPDRVWQTCRSLTRLSGGTHEFTVDVYAGICEMKALMPDAPLTKAEVHALISQLTFIEKMFEKVAK